MKTKNILITAISILMFGGSVAYSNQRDKKTTNNTYRSAQGLTADQQSMSAADTDITRKIRQDIMANGALSNSAQNVKIITIDGRVTLKGTVNSQTEIDTILKSANNAVGAEKVSNELQVSRVQ